MPEGDTIYRIAERFRPALEGRELVRVESRWAKEVRGLVGARVERVETVGKHMLLVFDDDTLLRVHLGMLGRWWRGEPGQRWPRSPADMGLALVTEETQLVCFKPKPVERVPLRHREKHAVLAALGPDLLREEFDLDEVLRRARRPANVDRDVADVLLDQTVSAGIGNVYKCEALFLQRVHPWTATSDLDDGRLLALFERARGLMRRNLGGGPRNTTGRVEPRLWIYGAMRRSCLECGAVPRFQHQGAQDRITWWCPSCQSGDEVA